MNSDQSDYLKEVRQDAINLVTWALKSHGQLSVDTLEWIWTHHAIPFLQSLPNALKRKEATGFDSLTAEERRRTFTIAIEMVCTFDRFVFIHTYSSYRTIH